MLSVAVCAVCVRVTVDRAGVVRVAEVRFVPAAVPPPPHDDSATDASKPNAPTATSPASELHEREPPTRSTPRTRRLCGCVLMERGLRRIPVRLSDLAIRSTRRVTRVRPAIRATGLLGSPNSIQGVHPVDHPGHGRLEAMVVPSSSSKASTIRAFLTYAVTTGQSFGPKLLFAPLPPRVVATNKTAIAKIR